MLGWMRMSCQFSTIFLSTYRINFKIRPYSFILNYPALLVDRIEFLCYFHSSLVSLKLCFHLVVTVVFFNDVICPDTYFLFWDVFKVVATDCIFILNHITYLDIHTYIHTYDIYDEMETRLNNGNELKQVQKYRTNGHAVTMISLKSVKMINAIIYCSW